jgi:hypothetical protein
MTTKEHPELVITERPSLDDVLLTPAEVAKRWSVSEASLAQLRQRGKGPRYYKLFNGLIRYPDWAVFEAEVGRAATCT